MNVASAVRVAFIDRGVDLVTALAELTNIDGWLTGAGYVENVELRVVGDGADNNVALRGRSNLLSLIGPRGGPFTVTLARMSDAGAHVLGGELVRAQSAGVTVMIQPAVRDARAAKIPDRPATWASAAAASARASGEDEDEEEHTPEVGDLVQHFAFGLCEVLMAEGDRLRIRDVEGPRRVREVALDMLRVTGPTMSNDKRLFLLARRGPA
jgi:hypothetical protein